MLLILGDIILFLLKTVFLIFKVTIKIFTFIFKTPFLRFTFIIFTLGCFFHVNFRILSTIYFIYLVHLCALKFNIYKKLSTDLKYLFEKNYNAHKVSCCLKTLKKDTIILNNIYLEDTDNHSCEIDELVITNGGIFAIKTFNYPYKDFVNNKNKIHTNIINFNNNNIIDMNLIDKFSLECHKCYDVLKNILTYDIPITNIIALPQDDLVVKAIDNLNTTIIVAKDLPYFIKNKTNKNINYSKLKIKENLLENKMWSFDIVILKLLNFLNHNKSIILFFTIFLIIYYFYITFVTYIFFKIISL